MTDTQKIKPSEYNKYGATTHTEVAKELKISVSLAHLIESNVFLKFALAYFSPPWPVREKSLRRLRDVSGMPVQFGEGQCSDLLVNVLRDVVNSENEKEFRKEYERRIVEIAKHPQFRLFVYSMLTGKEYEI